MNFGLEGKHALIGGGSKGLGLASALALAREGCRVTLVSRSEQNLRTAANQFESGGVVGLIPADLSTCDGRAECLAKMKSLPPVDILVNNTGGPPPGGSFVHDHQAWEKACEQLLYYVRDMCEAFLPGMRARGWGRVITITSITVKEPSVNLALSNIFRSAVTAYLKGLSKEAASDGVTVNNLLPGAFLTARYEEILAALSLKTGKPVDLLAKDVAARSPQGRFQRLEEFGAAAAFLASSQASGINGVSLPVDGGTLSGLF